MKKVLIIILVAATIVLGIIAWNQMAPRPDLIIETLNIEPVKQGKNVKITYVVKNQGKAAANQSEAFINILSKEGKDLGKSIKKDIPSLPPNSSYTTEISYPLVEKGNYNIKVTADYKDKIAESNEANNFNTVKFSIGLGIK
ncbi:MAG: DUF3324 domain-containing protein [Candidatus Saganbacteria bacterium]|nr:DUF3324 domain-containing protein [Candidatus Saganbacteria bacterium]